VHHLEPRCLAFSQAFALCAPQSGLAVREGEASSLGVRRIAAARAAAASTVSIFKTFSAVRAQRVACCWIGCALLGSQTVSACDVGSYDHVLVPHMIVF
jgi:hypothetical protein